MREEVCVVRLREKEMLQANRKNKLNKNIESQTPSFRNY